MRRFILLSVLALVAAALAVPVVWAGSAHFVGTPKITRAGDALTVSGKVAGLGNETQINVAVTADVACVNPGNNEPKAENKGATIAEGTFPVQNGKALFSVTGTGTTSPRLQPAHDPALQQRGGHRERRQLDPDLVFAFSGTF